LDETSLQWMAWFAAFWAAVIGFASWQERVRERRRFLIGLTIGAALAHFGWAALYLPLVAEQPRVLLEPTLGYCVLFLPAGLLIAAPWRARPPLREEWLAAAFGALPLALGIARLGCRAAGCCHGVATDVPWAIAARGGPPQHPTAWYEIAGLVALHLAIRRLPRAAVPGAVMIGFGAIRLAVEPWRAAPPLGAPLVPAAVLAAVWVAAGAAFLAPVLDRNRRPEAAKRRPKTANAARRRGMA
jgi:hypothetical protein